LTLAPDVRLAEGDHLLHFYDDDRALVSVVVERLVPALPGDDVVAVIATPDHRVLFEEGLTRLGVDVGAARLAGRYLDWDAAGMLGRFMVDGLPDATLFDSIFGDLARRTVAAGRRLLAYGEMVSLLWEWGNVAGAVALEDLWCGLSATVPFGLLCAYPYSHMEDRTTSTPSVRSAGATRTWWAPPPCRGRPRSPGVSPGRWTPPGWPASS